MAVQVAIMFFSCLSISFFSSKRHGKWGFVSGIIGQPFWFYATWTGEQWGMFVVSLYFMAMHLKGFYYHFWKRRI
jgi:hypothetical protein